jgi:hypothetical protein
MWKETSVHNFLSFNLHEYFYLEHNFVTDFALNQCLQYRRIFRASYKLQVVMWVVSSCSDVVGIHRFIWRQHGSPKSWYHTSTLHGVSTQNTTAWIFLEFRRHQLRNMMMENVTIFIVLPSPPKGFIGWSCKVAIFAPVFMHSYFHKTGRKVATNAICYLENVHKVTESCFYEFSSICA